jgi:hypothetical protein
MILRSDHFRDGHGTRGHARHGWSMQLTTWNRAVAVLEQQLHLSMPLYSGTICRAS